MKNCLNTRLKGIVDNENLPYFDSVVITVTPWESGTVGTIKVGPGQTGKLVSLIDGTEYPLSDVLEFANNQITGDTPQKFLFKSKYSAFPVAGSTQRTTGFSLNIDGFNYLPENVLEIINFNLGSINGDLNNIPDSNKLSTLVLNEISVTCTLEDILRKFPNIGVVTTNVPNPRMNIYNNSITGDVADLAALKAIPLDFYLPKQVEGNLYDAIVGWRENIVGTSNTGNMLCGSRVHLWSVYPNGKIFTLAWTADTSSITVNGVTTTFDNSGNIVS